MVGEADGFVAAHAAYMARDYAAAAALCEAALRAEPARADGWTLLGVVRRADGDSGEAVRCYRRAIELAPDYADAHVNLGNLLLRQGDPAGAAAAYRAALALRPHWREAENSLAESLRVSEQPEEALAVLRPLIEREPDFPDAYLTLGNTLYDLYRLEKAIVAYQRALALKPDYADAYYNLGNALRDYCHPAEAAIAYRKAIALQPDFHRAHSNLLFTLQVDPRQNRASLLREHLAWDALHGRKRARPAPEPADRRPERCLRIGLVSGDFCRHPVGFFLQSMLESLDPAEVALTCYSTTGREDALTDWLRARVAQWRDARRIDDEALDAQIRADAIDILIDLAGHTAGNRLTVFAMKPAPIQATWAGYVGTTGLAAMDYLISDPRETPPGCEDDYRERIARLPDCYVGYAPPDYAPAVGPLPMLARGHITLGCFNNLVKVTPEVVALWGELLRRLPDAQLLLVTRQLDEPGVAMRYRQLFEAEGVAERVRFEGRIAHPQLLARYNEIDLALDPFPYSGGLTTLEALWMGVPVVTLGGDRFAARHSVSHLTAAGLTETIVPDAESYLALVARLAGDSVRLAALRGGLRARMQASPLLDGARFARNWQAALRQMWRQYLGERDPAAQAAALLQRAAESLQAGRPEAAEASASRALALQPRADGHTLRGVARRRLGRDEAAEADYRAALALTPDYADAYHNLANLYSERGDEDAARAAYQSLLALRPDSAAGWSGLANSLHKLGCPAEAVAAGRRAVALAPDSAAAALNLANALVGSGEAAAEAEAQYRRARALDPGLRNAARNLGLLLRGQGRLAEAAEAFRDELARFPDHGEAWANLADCENRRGESDAAMAALRAAIALKPELASLHANLGALLHGLGRYDEAMACYREAERRGEADPVLHANIGNLHNLANRYGEALAEYRIALAQRPDDLPTRVHQVHVAQKLCDWQGFDALRATVVEPTLALAGEAAAPPPFPFLSFPCPISEAEQLRIAQRFARQLTRDIEPLPPRAIGPRPARLKVGYVSADFHNHATAHLMRGLFGRHDRTRFEVSAYSFGPDDGSAYRARIAADCDHFVELGPYGPAECARRIRADGIDVLVDLKGYTGASRPAIFAYRPAPLQLAWLGYPGSMGADFIDAAVVDPVVTPPAAQADYQEKLGWLPHCYQVNDDEQEIAAAPSREDCGLPAGAFVFCCFNAHYKLDPATFAVWLEILAAVPGSVLWLIEGYPEARQNLRREAAARGIDPARLVFAGKLMKPEHLARHVHADLFLDTRWYGAHTTASDALWAGVPVLSVAGETFASRVGASLLHAIGLPELVMADWRAYRDEAIALAQSPARLAALKAKLVANRTTTPLFDTAGFVRDLEALYDRLWDETAA
ncbi:O-linked N-acetylglucosamine transferase family protein [Chitinimonas koreensis]|uniref:O-linked N-acetylglucosamine transferase family protein n=1 Tax=Chitinimonas koreensis TaxID=356302 RepID=UPI000684DE59|nr:tetratricopeptide repeat protein [Chitinimonas koreensis]QNM96198.1 tetratricopeptide repeat protein [Chitinimonas koreensis]